MNILSFSDVITNSSSEVFVLHPKPEVDKDRFLDEITELLNAICELTGEDPNDIPNNLMPIIMKVSTGEIPILNVYGDDYDTVDGTGMRDFIHVVDLAKGHVAAIDHMKPGVSVYNLGTGTATSVLEMVAAFEKESGRRLPYQIAARRAGDLAKIYANAEKAYRELGWKTELTVKHAMRDTINYLKHVAKEK